MAAQRPLFCQARKEQTERGEWARALNCRADVGCPLLRRCMRPCPAMIVQYLLNGGLPLPSAPASGPTMPVTCRHADAHSGPTSGCSRAAFPPSTHPLPPSCAGMCAGGRADPTERALRDAALSSSFMFSNLGEEEREAVFAAMQHTPTKVGGRRARVERAQGWREAACVCEKECVCKSVCVCAGVRGPRACVHLHGRCRVTLAQATRGQCHVARPAALIARLKCCCCCATGVRKVWAVALVRGSLGGEGHGEVLPTSHSMPVVGAALRLCAFCPPPLPVPAGRPACDQAGRAWGLLLHRPPGHL